MLQEAIFPNFTPCPLEVVLRVQSRSCIVLATADFAGGRAHEGISKSALKVWLSAKDLIEELLREHDDYKLVLTG